MEKHLVIVESPTKAKTISRFLGKGFHVLSSYGHVRDLPKSSMGVDTDHDFTPEYTVPAGSKKHVQELKKAAKDADIIYFATDEDREGEAISWHLFELLKPKADKAKRITFHEITREAIDSAIAHPRAIDLHLVDSQQARRILDRLVGYELSPLLWKKIAYGLSAGRVQSVAVRLVVEREVERMLFKEASFWDIIAKLAKQGSGFDAKLLSVGTQRIATGKDFDETTGKLKKEGTILQLQQKDAEALAARLQKVDWTVTAVEEKPTTSYPAPPFITSTLQQEANRKLGLSSRDTMRVAQSLYEEGRITYMRTDSPILSEEGLQGARTAVDGLYGKEFLSAEPRQYKAKSRSAQEAHEAIRPAGATFTHPKDSGLSGKELALYELIWKRTLASQMAEAKKLSMNVQIAAADTAFQANGSTIVFPGFLRVYVEGSDDPDAALEDREVVLPKLAIGDHLELKGLEPQGHETKPPARYTDATLVKRLEQDGVGRPSTYASIIGTIIDRGYVRRMGNALAPTFTAFAVNALLTKYFSSLVDIKFTSRMEEALDEIAEGTREWQPYLKEFYSGAKGFHEQITTQEERIDPKTSRAFTLPHLTGVEVRVGRFGPYLVQAGGNGNGDDARASIPETIAPADLSAKEAEQILELQKNGPVPIGTHPETHEPIYVLTGRFGPYVQLGEKTDENPKPKRGSLPKDADPRAVTVPDALKYLSLPRTLGVHPERGKDVVASVGRFGPYVVCDGDFRSLKKEDDVYSITLERACELLAQEKTGRGNRAKTVRELGEHPKDKKPVTILDGKFGLYVKHGTTNASLPKDSDPNAVTMDQAVELLNARKSKKKK